MRHSWDLWNMQWERKVRIHTARPEPVAAAIRRQFGRTARQTERPLPAGSAGKAPGAGASVLELVISRLELAALADLVAALDPGATIDAFPSYRESRGPIGSGGVKRHGRPDLDDVSKYGNPLG